MLKACFAAGISLFVTVRAAALELDVDADGVADTVQLDAAGQLTVRAGIGGAVLRTFTPPAGTATQWQSWSLLPSVSADAVPDLLAFAPTELDAGGNVIGSVWLLDPATGVVKWVARGTENAPFGSSVAAITDQDFDGLDEVVVQVNGSVPRVAIVASSDGFVLAVRDGTLASITQLLSSGVSLYSPADRDSNGLIDADDFKDFVLAYENGAVSADINRDAAVDASDLARFVNGFVEGGLTMEAGGSMLATLSSGSGGNTGGGTLQPPQSLPGDEPGEDPDCGCSEADPNPSDCEPATMRIVCPDIRDWPLNGGYVSIPWSVYLPVNGTGLGVSCYSDCGNVQPQPVAGLGLGTPVINHVSGTQTVYVQPGQRFIRICYDYQMAGSSSVCTVCTSCGPDCTPFSNPIELEMRAPRYMIPGRTYFFEALPVNEMPESVVCDQWVWTIIEGAEWISSPQFAPATLPIPGLPPETPVYIGDSWIELIITDNEVPNGTRPVVVLRAICQQRALCGSEWNGAEGGSFVCGDDDDDLLADCEELDMAAGGNCPDPANPDSDFDSFDDGVEVLHGSNPCLASSTPIGGRDADWDGASDYEEEVVRRTNRDRFDQDRDGLQDYAEFVLGTNPRDPHSQPQAGVSRDGELAIAIASDKDSDGLFDQYEQERGWDSGDPDQDRDGIRDGLEVRRRLNPRSPDQGPLAPGVQRDSDGDGLSDAVEARLGTNPSRRDTDGDGVSDGNEARMGLDPNSARTYCTDCGPLDADADWDHDGLSNKEEEQLGLDPANSDSDGDGKCDQQDLQDVDESPECTPPDPCWTPNNGQNADCSGGACIVLHIPCSTNGGTVIVNGESYTVPACNSGQPKLFVPVRPGDDFSIAFSCDAWSGHDAPQLGAACRNASGQFDQNSYQPDSQNSHFAYEKEYNDNPSDCANGTNSGFGGSQHGTVPPFTATTPEPGQDCLTDFNALGPLTLNLWIDSDNNSKLKVGSVNSADEELEPEVGNGNTSPPNHPGKILFAATGDSDGDRIPDFADGYDLDDHGTNADYQRSNPHFELDNISEGSSFVPLTVTLGGRMPPGTKIKFSYSAAKPTDTKPVENDPSGALFVSDSLGLLRIWTKQVAPPPTPPPGRGRIYGMGSALADGTIPSVPAPPRARENPCIEKPRDEAPRRSKLDVAEGGSFVDDNVAYTIEQLNGGYAGNQITLLVEAVRASTTVAEGTITATLVLPASAQGIAQTSDTTDAVRCTAIDKQIRPINTIDGSLLPAVRETPMSHPTPIISIAQYPNGQQGFAVMGPVVISSADPSRLEANILVHGSLRDAASDLIPGQPGEIRWLTVVVNGELLEAEDGEPSVGLRAANGEVIFARKIETINRRKRGGAALTDALADRRLRPYQFSADFAGALRVPVSVGTNTVRLLATNAYGLTGFVEYEFTVESSAPPPDHARATLNLHGQELPNATLPVTLTVADRPHNGQFGPPASFVLFPVAGRPGEFADATGVTATVLSDLTTSATTLDLMLVEVSGLSLTPAQGQTISTIQVAMTESAASPGLFSGDEELGAEYHPELSYYNFSAHQADVELRAQSTGGDFAPFGLQMVGPPEVFTDQFVGKVQFGAETYVLGVTDEMLATRDSPANLAAKQSASFVAIARFNVQEPEPEGKNEPNATMGDRGAENVPWGHGIESTDAFVDGFAKGLLDTAVEIKDGVIDVGKAIWHIALNYNKYAINMRLATRQGFFLAEDEDKLRASWKLMKTIGEIAVKVVTDEISMVTAVYYEDEQALRELGEEYAIYAGIAIDLLAGLKDEIQNITPYQAGWITGRVIGEVAVQVAPALVTGGTSVAATIGFRSVQLTNIAAKVRNAVFAQKLLKLNGAANASMVNDVIHQADNALRVAVRVATTRMCFVAGTLVLTSQGLVPIEQIKPNDIVWAMDEVSREAGWKPVVQTFVTHPTQLHTVTWQTQDGRIDGVTGTGEHPFYVVSVDKFVSMASLCVGDTLQLADGTLAWIVKAGLSSGPPDDEQSFTTYNFEVEDFHTYFVGETGAWVHNTGARCVKFKRMMEYRAAKRPPNAQNPTLDYLDIRAKYEQRGVPLAAADDKDVVEELLLNMKDMARQNQLDPRIADLGRGPNATDIDVEEVFGAVRYEQKSGRRLVRSSDGSADFEIAPGETGAGTRIDLKGPFVRDPDLPGDVVDAVDVVKSLRRHFYDRRTNLPNGTTDRLLIDKAGADDALRIAIDQEIEELIARGHGPLIDVLD